MANRFSNLNVAPTQYVHKPLDMYLKSGLIQDKQVQDAVDKTNSDIQDASSYLTVFSKDTKDKLALNENLNNQIQEFAKKDPRDPLVHNAIHKAIFDYTNSPTVNDAIARTQSFADHQKEVERLGKDYKPQNDPYLKDSQLYETQQDPEAAKRLRVFQGITPYFDTDKQMQTTLGSISQDEIEQAKGFYFITDKTNNTVYAVDKNGNPVDTKLTRAVGTLPPEFYNQMKLDYNYYIDDNLKEHMPFNEYVHEYLQDAIKSKTNTSHTIVGNALGYKMSKDAQEKADEGKALPLSFNTEFNPNPEGNKWNNVVVKDGVIGKGRYDDMFGLKGNLQDLGDVAANFFGYDVKDRPTFEKNEALQKEVEDFISIHRNPDGTVMDVNQGVQKLKELYNNASNSYQAYNTIVPPNFNTTKYSTTLVQNFLTNGSSAEIEGQSLKINDIASKLGYKSAKAFVDKNPQIDKFQNMQFFGTNIPGSVTGVVYDSGGKPHKMNIAPSNEVSGYFTDLQQLFGNVDLSSGETQINSVQLPGGGGMSSISAPRYDQETNSWKKETTLAPSISTTSQAFQDIVKSKGYNYGVTAVEKVKKELIDKGQAIEGDSGNLILLVNPITGDNLSKSPNEYIHQRFTNSMNNFVQDGGLRNYFLNFIDNPKSHPAELDNLLDQ